MPARTSGRRSDGTATALLEYGGPGIRRRGSLLAVRCSLLAVRCSLFALFAVRCSLFAVRCSLFAVRCSLFADYARTPTFVPIGEGSADDGRATCVAQIAGGWRPGG